MEDVGRIIMSSQSKSCASDPLPTNTLKEFLPEILPFITDMCNTSLRQGMLSLSQRHAIVTSRLKKADGDPIDSRNYRPISKLTFTSKLVGRLVWRQLVAFLERERLLPTYQSAYRKHHSTEMAILKIISDALLVADRGDVTLLGLLDLSAAFDTVDHAILIDRLRTAFGIRGSVLSQINSFISVRTQTVIFNGTKSTRSVLDCDVL